MQNVELEVLPEQPETQIQVAVYRDGLSTVDTSLTNEEIIDIACCACAAKAQTFRDLITLTLVEI